MKVTTTIHMSEAEVAWDLHAVLAQAQQGIEIVIEQDHRPVAVIKQPPPVGRMISEILADLKARGSQAFVDDDFAHDVEKRIESQRQSWTAILGVVHDLSIFMG